MIFEVWENELPIEAFAQEVLLWPAPKDGHAYSYAEVKTHSIKHTRKFTGGLLAAMVLTLHVKESETEKVARYMGVDPKKLRNQAAANLEAERLRVPEPQTPKDKVLFTAVDGQEKEWTKLRKSGATDKEIQEFLCRRFGEYGGHGAPGLPWIHYRGTNNNPRVWFKMDTTGTPHLAGAELIAKVRELLNIAQKGGA